QPGDEAKLRSVAAEWTWGANQSGIEAALDGVNAQGKVEEPSQENSLLALLLDSQQGFWVLVLLASGFGATHALTPGHGNTLVAAFLVGERGTVLHAFILGVVTTLTHTGTVLVLAAALLFLFPHAVPEHIQLGLGLVGGLLIAGMGIWLLLRRISGSTDH